MNPSSDNFRFYVFTEMRAGISVTDIHHKLQQVWADAAPGLSTIRRWCNTFRNSDEPTLHDLPRSGRPVSVITEENIELVRQHLSDDPRLSIRDLEESLNIPRESIHRIIKDNLNLRDVCSVWIPHALSAENKVQRVNCAKHIRRVLLPLGEAEMMRRLAVEDETWVPFESSMTKMEGKAWLPPGAPRPRAVRPQMSDRKTLLLLAFTPSGRFSVQAMPRRSTIDSEVYVDFVRATGEKWRKLHSDPILLKDIFWQHDNARPHSAQHTADFFNRRNISLLWQAPYSPDMNMCDRWLFAELKKGLRKASYASEGEIEEAALQCLRDIPVTKFSEELQTFLQHCQLVINCGGDYVTH